MTKYMVYEKSESGAVTRTGLEVAEHEVDLRDYPHGRGLMGWAENYVRWNKEAGPSIGVAKMGDLS